MFITRIADMGRKLLAAISCFFMCSKSFMQHALIGQFTKITKRETSESVDFGELTNQSMLHEDFCCT